MAYVDCELFTVSMCDHSSKKYDGPPGLDERTCQVFCESMPAAKFYRYQKAGSDETSTCGCFSHDYRQDCGIVGGNPVYHLLNI